MVTEAMFIDAFCDFNNEEKEAKPLYTSNNDQHALP
jgi:hypothetical protein